MHYSYALIEISKSHFCCSVTKLCPTLWDPMGCSVRGFPVLHHLLEFAQTPVHRVRDTIQPSHALLPASPSVLNLFPASGSIKMSQLFTSEQLTFGGFPGGSDGKESACNEGNWGLIPLVRKIPWRREWLPALVLLPNEFHEQRSPATKSQTWLSD